MISVGIVGGTGYTGVELIRLLTSHPAVSLDVITSRGQEGEPVTARFPSLRGAVDASFQAPDISVLGACDLVFFATPHGVAMDMAPQLLACGVRMVDLSADFRLRDAAEWARWYGQEHRSPELLAQAVYGLPEMNRAEIESARLVANPGCYPTAVQLGYMPLLKGGMIDPDHLIADCKSGASGAGRVAREGLLFAEIGESFKAYAASGHRHLPEIHQQLSAMAGGGVGVTFVPHLVPMTRGIHATLYGRLHRDLGVDEIQAVFDAAYAAEPFVDVLAPGSHPATHWVRGGNSCRLAVHRPQGGRDVVVLSVIDNLVKGAAGQAIQNMNIMLGLPEATGLECGGLAP